MAENYRVSPRAQNDLWQILRYIAQDNFAAAERMRELFYQAFALLGEHPHLGQQRGDLTTKPVRFWPVHRHYMIIYDARTSPVPIIRIYNTARHIASIIE